MTSTLIKFSGDSQVRSRAWKSRDDNQAPYTTYMFVGADGKLGFIHHNEKEDLHYVAKAYCTNKSGSKFKMRAFRQYNLKANQQRELSKFCADNEPNVIFNCVLKSHLEDDIERVIDLFCHLLTKFPEEIHEHVKVGHFIPEKKHDVGEGAWIMVPNYQSSKKGTLEMIMVFAKRSTRRSYAHITKDITNAMYRLSDEELSNDKKIASLEIKRLNQELRMIRKQNEANVNMDLHHFSTSIACKPYEVVSTLRSRNGKPKRVHFAPGEYFVIEDIDVYLDLVMDGNPDLKSVSVTNHETADRIFYLQSRGISKKRAEVLCNLKNTHFVFSEDVRESLLGRLTKKSEIEI